MVKYLNNFPKININNNNNFKKSTAKKWPKRNCPPADALCPPPPESEFKMQNSKCEFI